MLLLLLLLLLPLMLLLLLLFHVSSLLSSRTAPRSSFAPLPLHLSNGLLPPPFKRLSPVPPAVHRYHYLYHSTLLHVFTQYIHRVYD